MQGLPKGGERATLMRGDLGGDCLMLTFVHAAGCDYGDWYVCSSSGGEE
jgi:hypothetical protein